MEKLESNSISSGKPASGKRSPSKQEEREKIEKIVKGHVSKQKKSIGQKLGESLLSEESDGVGSYIFNDVLLPAVKDTIVDMVTGAINMAFYGDTRGPGRRSSGSRFSRGSAEVVSYDRRYGSRGRDTVPRGRARYDVDNIVFGSRQEADEVLDVLLDYIDRYEVVTVADFYQALDMPTQSTDFKYGWASLGRARIHPSRGGYVLEMPKVEPID